MTFIVQYHGYVSQCCPVSVTLIVGQKCHLDLYRNSYELNIMLKNMNSCENSQYQKKITYLGVKSIFWIQKYLQTSQWNIL